MRTCFLAEFLYTGQFCSYLRAINVRLDEMRVYLVELDLGGEASRLQYQVWRRNRLCIILQCIYAEQVVIVTS